MILLYLTSSGLLYAAPKNFDVSIVFFGLSRIVVSGPISKLSIEGGRDVPNFTVKLLSFGSVARLLTADMKALRFSNVKDSLPFASGLQSWSRSISSSVVRRQAEETKACFLAYSSISSATLQGHFMVVSSPRPTVTTDNFNLQACASGWKSLPRNSN